MDLDQDQKLDLNRIKNTGNKNFLAILKLKSTGML
jgi:hypothetical protein